MRIEGLEECSGGREFPRRKGNESWGRWLDGEEIPKTKKTIVKSDQNTYISCIVFPHLCLPRPLVDLIDDGCLIRLITH